MNNIHHSICGVIPPHMLEQLVASTDPQCRKTIVATMERTDELRLQREAASAHGANTSPTPQRYRVYDARHRYKLPGHLVTDETRSAIVDIEVQEALSGAAATHDFYQSVFGRASIDGNGLTIDSSVHYGTHFDNAVWDGTRMVYGDGDGRYFNRFTIAVDVIGHELTHGVTEYASNLGYSGQTGALNEHLSDAFGIMVKQYALKLKARDSDWLIGAGLLAEGVKGVAVRSMKAPGTAYNDPVIGRDPQPAHMRDYVNTRADNGGVHVNSGIPNHAFYLAATAVGGYTWESVGAVWYGALTSRVRYDAHFHDFANATVAEATELFAENPTVPRAIANAWAAVGVPVTRPLASRRFASGGKWDSQPYARTKVLQQSTKKGN